jgi:hypothetical protein
VQSAFGRNLGSEVMRAFLCVRVWQEFDFNGREEVLTFFFYFVEKFYKCCTFIAISKDNTAVNCITFQHKKGVFPLTLTGHFMLLIQIIQKNEMVRRCTFQIVCGLQRFPRTYCIYFYPVFLSQFFILFFHFECFLARYRIWAYPATSDINLKIILTLVNINILKPVGNYISLYHLP